MIENATGPLLTRFATNREAGQDIPGEYCKLQRMWVVNGPDGEMPLIEASKTLAEITTKTKVELESDDTADHVVLQLVSKTDVQTERDDVTKSAAGLLALETKTFANTEEDKQDVDAWGSGLSDHMFIRSVHDARVDDLSIPLAVRVFN